MDYKIMINEFEGPMDLLLHLIKKADIDICNISIEEITKQYFNYINEMEKMDLNIASEYLIMAAELIEIKSSILLPKPYLDDDEFEEDPRERLIRKLLEYKHYKEMTGEFKKLEEERRQIYTKEANNLKEYKTIDPEVDLGDIGLDDLIGAFNKFLQRKKEEQPINTKVTTREYSINDRSIEIKSILKLKNKISFEDLFEELNRNYIVVTFLSVLSLSKRQEIEIKQDDNFGEIMLSLKGSE